MEHLVQDIRFAFRMLIKSPVVTAAAILSLALGIGANTTIFTLVNAVFLRGLPVEDPDSLVAVFTTEEQQQFGAYMPVSRPNYEDLRDHVDAFEELVNVMFTGVSLVAPGGEPEQAFSQMVTSNYFTALGVTTSRGRLFRPEENEAPGSQPVVVLSHNYWTQRFGADPGILGETVQLNGHTFTIIGVAPRGFTGTFILGGNPSLWVPVSMHREILSGPNATYFDDRRALLTNVFGRLRSGVSQVQAEGALERLSASLEEEHPVDNKNRSFTSMPLAQAAINPNQREDFTRAGGFLMIVVGLVLLIACGNVANLMLGRAQARRREIGVRLALGAPRFRLVQQLLTESALLAFLAGILGLGFAAWARTALWSLRPPFLQQSALDLGFDPQVLAFTLVLTLLTALIFGLVPALQATRPRLVGDLTQSSGSAGGAHRVWSLKNGLVVAQVALSLVALIGAGLFLRSLSSATEIDLGFDPEGMGIMNVNLGAQGYDPARGEQFFTAALERIRSVPGVESASFTTSVPLAGASFWRTVLVEGRDEAAENNRILTPVNTVASDYFKTAGMELLRGRDLSAGDRAETVPVAVISEAMARRFWPDEDPLGARFQFYGIETVREVVGVVEDSKYQTLGESPQPQVFVPRLQNYVPQMMVALRTTGEPGSVLQSVRNELQQLDATLPITNVQPMSVLVSQALWGARMSATLLAALGALALLLAAIGIYGVMSYNVSQRDREIGVRMAMGAGRAQVLRLVLGQGMRVIAVGLLIGLALAVLAGRFIAGLLYGVPPTDPVTFGGILLLLAAVALVATWVPARRATGVDPVSVLRFER